MACLPIQNFIELNMLYLLLVHKIIIHCMYYCKGPVSITGHLLGFCLQYQLWGVYTHALALLIGLPSAESSE